MAAFAIALGLGLEQPVATTMLTILAGLCYLAVHGLTHGLILC